jgi:hypothetical protein
MAVRVLITGSRTWVNAAVIRGALLNVWGDGEMWCWLMEPVRRALIE